MNVLPKVTEPVCPQCKQRDKIVEIGALEPARSNPPQLARFIHVRCERCNLVLHVNEGFGTYGYCGAPEEHVAAIEERAVK